VSSYTYFLVSLALLIVLFNTNNIFQYAHQLRAIPSAIKVAYPVAMGTEGDLWDGCAVTVFKLAESTIKILKIRELNFLAV